MSAWSERHLMVGDAGTFLDEQRPLSRSASPP
jgi:hypothetical protein